MDLFYPQSYAHNSGEEEDVTRCIIDGQVGDPSKDFGWPAWSKNNCEYYTNSLYFSSCSNRRSKGNNKPTIDVVFQTKVLNEKLE